MAAGRKLLAALQLSEIDRIQTDRGLAFIDDIGRRIKQCETTITPFSKSDATVKRLKTIPGIGEFFARLIDAEIDDIGRFRSAKKLAAMPASCPQLTRVVARPITAESSSRATNGCAGPLSRR